MFELNDDSQVIAKYLDARTATRPVPARDWKASNPFSGATSRMKSRARRSGSTTFTGGKTCRRRNSCDFLRYKERKFGRGCIDQWRKQQNDWLKRLEAAAGAV